MNDIDCKKNKKKSKRRKRISKFTILIFLLDIIVVDGLILINNDKFKSFWIPTAMTTMSHKYLAYTLYDESTVNEVMSKNYIEENTEKINLDDIVIGDNKEKSHYSSKYEKDLFTRMEGNEVYKIIRIEETKYKGYLTVIYDPSDVSLAVSAKLGKAGQSVSTLVKNNGGLVGINGGGFEDLDGWGNGSIPYGAIIKDGQLIWQHSGGSGQLIGFTRDHKMYLTDKSPEEAINDGMVDAVEFGPNLIVNGKVSKIHGDGGWGTAPRSVIAQRKDGIVLFLVLNGRRGTKTGADMDDLIDILQDYGAYNAANLDGGTSSVLVVGDTIVNDPIDSTGAHKTRPISTGFIVTKDDSNDSDHKVVADKLGE